MRSQGARFGQVFGTLVTALRLIEARTASPWMKTRHVVCSGRRATSLLIYGTNTHVERPGTHHTAFSRRASPTAPTRGDRKHDRHDDRVVRLLSLQHRHRPRLRQT